MDDVSKADALPMGGGHPSIRSGPGENKAEEGRIYSELDHVLPSAFLVLRPSDLDCNLPQQLSGSQAFEPQPPALLGFQVAGRCPGISQPP